MTPSSSASAGGFTGQKALIATTLNLLSSDSSSGNGLDICEHVLASKLRAALNKTGSCQTDLNNQIKTVDEYTVTIKSITLAGSTASARVQTVHNGTKVIQTVTLAKEKAGWRITSAASV